MKKENKMNPDNFQFKNFAGSVNFCVAEKYFYGKIESINDLVTFEGCSAKELKKAFHEAVNDYIQLCMEANKGQTNFSCK